jgi:Condensation domain
LSSRVGSRYPDRGEEANEEGSYAVATLSAKRLQLLALLRQDHAGSAANATTIPRLPRQSGRNIFPASFAQQRLWFLYQLDPSSTAYNVVLAFRVSGPLRVDVFARSLGALAQRHEVLRTVFGLADGHPVQIVLPELPVPLTVVDLRDRATEHAALIQRLAHAEVAQPFDLTTGPLLRVKLLALAATEYIYILTVHHIVADAWSFDVFTRELAVLYQAFCAERAAPLAELPIQYAEYAIWQRQWLASAPPQLLNYWRAQLADAPKSPLPTDRPRPPLQSVRGTRRLFALSAPLSTALKALRSEGVTLFMLFLATFQCLLYSYSGQPDVVIGTDVANRRWPETEGLIGFFVNQLVLRSDLAGDPTFREVLGRARETALAAYAHQDLPFDKLVELLNPARTMGYTPLFQTKLVLQNAALSELHLPGLTLAPVEIESATTKFDLLLNIVDRGPFIAGCLEYATDLFSAARVTQLLHDYELLLETVVSQPMIRLSALSALLAEMGRQQQATQIAELKAARQQKVLKVRQKISEKGL